MDINASRIFKHYWILLGIILLASFLRFYQITYHDSYTDEAVIAFRSIGLIDYDASPEQTTPWQWYERVPWWGYLSLHDHPLGYFLLQHASMLVAGETVFTARLPSALAGIGVVWLLYAIGKKLWGEQAGLLAAALGAVQSYALWVSRLGIQDGVVIVLLLLIIWCLLEVNDNPRYWLAVGALVGIGIFTKYTIAIIFPMIILYCITYRISPIRNKFFWYGVLFTALCSMPSWLYNLMLYSARGHFDFQISAFLGQNVPEWQFRMGRQQVGGLSNRFHNFWLAMYYGNSQIFNALSGIAVAASVYTAKKSRDRGLLFIIGCVILMSLWFLVIGSTYRFVVMVVPFLIFLISCAYVRIAQVSNLRMRILSPFFMCAYIMIELLFSVNSYFLHPSHGKPAVAYARVNEETQNFGWQELEAFLAKELHGKVSALTGTAKHAFIAELQDKRIRTKKASGATTEAKMIIYEKDLNFIASLWTFDRRLIYDGWPVISDRDFIALTNGKMDAYYREQGVASFLYIAAANDLVKRASGQRVYAAEELKQYLAKQGIEPDLIANQREEPAFWVYRF